MIAKRCFFLVYAVMIGAGVYLSLHRDLAVPMKKSFDQFPSEVSQWRMSRQDSISEEVQAVLKASDVLVRQYVNGAGERVELYIGYHDGAKGSGQIHSPKNCLPGSGWFEVSSSRTRLASPAGDLNLVRAVYQKGDAKELFLYWYQVRGESHSQEYSLKLAEIANSVRYRRRDAAFIRVSVPFDGSEPQAIGTGERFVTDFLPAILAFLPS